MREFIINSNDAGQRLDKFVLKTVKGIPASLMYKSIRLKKIKVNRRRAEEKQILEAGDTVQMFLSEDLFSDKIEASELMSVTPKLKIVYEDENIIICNKPAGVLVHSGEGDACDPFAVRRRVRGHTHARRAVGGRHRQSASDCIRPGEHPVYMDIGIGPPLRELETCPGYPPSVLRPPAVTRQTRNLK